MPIVSIVREALLFQSHLLDTLIPVLQALSVLLLLRAFAWMFCLLGTFFPLIFTRLAASHHSRLCLNATSHGLSQHASTLSLVFYFLQRLSLSDCFLHLPIFCIPLLTCKLLENTLLSRLPLSVVFSVVIQTVGSGIRFARFGCCH